MDRTEPTGRRSIRLRGWDYRSAGWYFVTINCWGNCHTLARVRNGAMHLTRMGEVVTACWREIPLHQPIARLDAFVVMPNHVHGIVVIARSTHRATTLPLNVRANSLGAVVRSFKAASTRVVHVEVAMHLPVWQRNYYERILRDADAIAAVRKYIRNNPARWIARRGDG